MRHLFFDLDGTLTDPGAGITKCICYALDELGREPPGQTALEQCIGPPLRAGFARLLATEDERIIERAMISFRERFSEVGWRENRVYEGIPETLHLLRELGCRLSIVTSKPLVFARRIVDHFALNQYFEDVHGAELNGAFDDKRELLAAVLKKTSLREETSLMIGDRREDIAAGKHNGLKTIGVLYGYGTRCELDEAGADALVDSPEDIPAVVKRVTD